jgi:hypothetical protein
VSTAASMGAPVVGPHPSRFVVSTIAMATGTVNSSWGRYVPMSPSIRWYGAPGIAVTVEVLLTRGRLRVAHVQIGEVGDDCEHLARRVPGRLGCRGRWRGEVDHMVRAGAVAERHPATLAHAGSDDRARRRRGRDAIGSGRGGGRGRLLGHARHPGHLSRRG